MKSFAYRSVFLALVFAMLAAGFKDMILNHLPGVFAAPEEDLDFAWFIPAMSLAIVWRERRAIAASAGAPSWAGVAVSLPFFFIGFLGVRGLQVRFELLAFAGLLIALPFAFFGRKTARAVFFPAALLLFCMPLQSYLSLFTVHLRLLVSSSAAAVVQFFGVETIRHGNIIILPGVGGETAPFTIDVANPCSGLRSIFALMAISACYGYFSLPTWSRRFALFVLSVPLAVLGNIVRIFSICMVAKCADTSFATGFYHDFSGYVVFAVAIFFMIVACGLLAPRNVEESGDGGGEKSPDAGGSEASEEAGAASVGASGFFACAAAVALTVAAMALQLALPAPKEAAPPEISMPEIEAFASSPVDPSVAETNILAGATIEKRVYTGESGFWFQVSCVVSAANKGSLHRPELCLPSQGFQMMPSRGMEVEGVPWQTIPLTAGDGGPGAFLAYTFVNQDGFRTASHLSRIFRDVWDRSFKGQIDRWAMTTVFVPSGDEKILLYLLEKTGSAVK